MTNEEVIRNFYSAFSAGDAAYMAASYHPNAIFTDPAFGKLNCREVQMMWHMLISRSNNKLHVVCTKITSNQNTVIAHWTAIYIFGKGKRKVTNHVTSQFEMANGLVVRQVDYFNLFNWAKQALGAKGILLGWSSFFKNQLQKKSQAMLKKYMMANS